MKKLLVILLSALMLTSICFTAFAAGTETTGSITITNAEIGETYKVYKVFDLTYSGDEQPTNSDGKMLDFTGTVSYSYTKTGDDDAVYTALTDGINGTDSPFTLTATTVNNTYNVEIKDSYTDETTGEANTKLISFMKLLEPKLTPVQSKEATGTTLEFTGLGLGYYYVTSTMGTVVTIDSTLKDVRVEEKNVAPKVEKFVKEDSKAGTADEWGKTNDADAYDTVEYKTTITAQPGAENYVLEDDFSVENMTGTTPYMLLNPNTFTIEFPGDNIDYSYKGQGSYESYFWPVQETYNDNTNMYNQYEWYLKMVIDGTTKYVLQIGTITYKTSTRDFTGFTITFTDPSVKGSLLSKITEKGTMINIYYNAKLRGATDPDQPNVNTTKLKFGAKGETIESSTRTYTWTLPVFKYTGDNTTKTPLANAEFTLTRKGETDPLKFVASTDNSRYTVRMDGDTTAVTTTKLVSLTNGKFAVAGLDSGEYILTETKAPDGYNILTAPITIKIDENGKIFYNDGDETADTWTKSQDQVEVLNNSGSVLPSTGGMGTTIFYIVGGLLVAGALVFFIVRRRMRAGDKAAK